MNSEEPANRLVFYCEGLPGLPGGLKKALRGPLVVLGRFVGARVSLSSDIEARNGKRGEVLSRFCGSNFLNNS